MRRQKVVRLAAAQRRPCPGSPCFQPRYGAGGAVLELRRGPLESVPNFSEGRDTRDDRRDRRRDRGSRAAARRPRRRRPQPLGVHARRRGRRADRGARRGGRGRPRADRPAAARRARTRGSAPPTSSRSCRSSPTDLERAHAVALALGERIGALGLPVFVYEPPERGPAFYRRGGSEELQRRIDAGELAPDFGPSRLDPAAGGVIVGARKPLIAFNVNLRGSLEAGAGDRRARPGAGRRLPRASARSASTCRRPGSSRCR